MAQTSCMLTCCSREKDLFCTYLTHHELQCGVIIIIMIVVVIVIIIIIINVIIIVILIIIIIVVFIVVTTITIMLQELESLKGWKYLVSLLLEAGDIALPIFRNCMARVSAAISWLLVKLIGRALGLIYRGVKQSLVPQRQKQRKGQTASTDTEGPQTWMPKFS